MFTLVETSIISALYGHEVLSAVNCAWTIPSFIDTIEDCLISIIFPNVFTLHPDHFQLVGKQSKDLSMQAIENKQEMGFIC